MNLLHTEFFRVETFHGSRIPPYAILSHTWGDDEVLFPHIENTNGPQNNTQSRGWSKIIHACRIARQHNPPFEYIWIDTCCIDRASSSQLSEAINSMFKWYEMAGICYAHLEGVEMRQETALLEESLKKARWFRRGWTLQELIAPANVVFFSEDWKMIGSKNSLREVLSLITGISVNVLLHPRLLPTQSVARRMSWAAFRKTTRVEDIAYCLIGIFNVNMPLIYGEGNQAFIRLQEDIIKNSEDQSLFGWQYQADSTETEDSDFLENEGIFAHHPVAFKRSFDIVSHQANSEPYRVTQRGLEIQLPIIHRTITNEHDTPFVGILSCHYETNLSGQIGIPLDRVYERYYRRRGSALIFLQHEEAESAIRNTVYVHKSGKRHSQDLYSSYCYLRRHPPEVYFSDGVASAAAVSTSASESDNIRVYTPWNKSGKTVVLPAEYDGHVAALEFTTQQRSSPNWGLPDGFIVVVRLFPHNFGVIAIVQWSQHERRTHGFLHRTLETHGDASISTVNSFRFGRGHLRVALEKKLLFDRETYFVDIDFMTLNRSDPMDMAVNRISDIRLLESDGLKHLK
jgi:Heterokaryon incompatibility protein (HET)